MATESSNGRSVSEPAAENQPLHTCATPSGNYFAEFGERLAREREAREKAQYREFSPRSGPPRPEPEGREPRELPVTWDWPDQETIPEQPWIVHGMIPAFSTGIVHGPGKAGKSTLLAQLESAIARGYRRWFHGGPELQTTTPARVLHVSGEETWEDQLRRFQKIGTSPKDLGTYFGFHRLRGPIFDSRGPTDLGDDLILTVRAHNPAWITLDPVAAVYAGNENDRSQVRAFYQWLDEEVAQGKRSVALIAHPGKERSYSDQPSGCTDWLNAPRWHMHVGRLTESEAQGGVAKRETKRVPCVRVISNHLARPLTFWRRWNRLRGGCEACDHRDAKEQIVALDEGGIHQPVRPEDTDDVGF